MSRASRPTSFLRIAVLAFLLVVGSGTFAAAEIYRWRDEQGRLHFSQDLNQVPVEHRAQARSGALATGQGPEIQRYEAAPAAPRSSPGQSSRAGGPVHRIHVERMGSTMRVTARLNDRVTVHFYVDTGASDVVIPRAVADALGLRLEGARTAFYGTANGTVEQSLVTLDSVQLGGARAESVPATVSESMDVGLLGLSFFNHFRYRVDPETGTLTLQSNGLAEAGRIRGGRSERQWRQQFGALRGRREAIERAKDDAGSNRSRRQAELEALLDEVDRQRSMLEDEADEARVPMQWRD